MLGSTTVRHVQGEEPSSFSASASSPPTAIAVPHFTTHPPVKSVGRARRPSHCPPSLFAASQAGVHEPCCPMLSSSCGAVALGGGHPIPVQLAFPIAQVVASLGVDAKLSPRHSTVHGQGGPVGVAGRSSPRGLPCVVVSSRSLSSCKTASSPAVVAYGAAGLGGGGLGEVSGSAAELGIVVVASVVDGAYGGCGTSLSRGGGGGGAGASDSTMVGDATGGGGAGGSTITLSSAVSAPE